MGNQYTPWPVDPSEAPVVPVHLQDYVAYIRNTGQAMLKTDDFDDDWSPVGPAIRASLLHAGVTLEDGGVMILRSTRD